jgi:hypothetical protein
MEKNKGKFKKIETFDVVVLLLYVLPLIFVAGYYLGYVTAFRIVALIIGLMFLWSVYERLKNRDLRTMGILSLVIFLICAQLGFLITNSIIDGVCMGCYLAMAFGAIESIYHKIKGDWSLTEDSQESQD